MQKLQDARCSVCTLPASYHSIKHKAFKKGPNGPVETDEPPHRFNYGGR